jgi:hypothetical protein
MNKLLELLRKEENADALEGMIKTALIADSRIACVDYYGFGNPNKHCRCYVNNDPCLECWTEALEYRSAIKEGGR